MRFSRAQIGWMALGLTLTCLSSCGGGSSVNTASNSIRAPNEVRIYVDDGPTGDSVNRLYTDITICETTNTTNCQTVDHILVDTGSTGLRILASAMPTTMAFTPMTANNGLALLSCAQFLDTSFAWGPVVSADVRMGTKVAKAIPIQIVADTKYSKLSNVCASGISNDTAAVLGANGIVGLSFFKEDCGVGCASIKSNGFYYACADQICSTAVPTTAPLNKQLANPVALFSSDDNGIAIELPAVLTDGQQKLDGTLRFGVGTQENNRVVSSKVLYPDADYYVETTFGGKQFINSFIDTGSNGIYFDDPSIPICSAPNSQGYYCPTVLMTQPGTITGANRVQYSLNLTISNALNSFANTRNTVLPYLTGPVGDATIFDWGLPFFYGRKVYIGIEGKASNVGTGSYYAF